MAIVYTQTDTAAPLGVIQACAPVSPAADADAVEATVGGTAGITEQACDVAASSSELCYAVELDISDTDSLDAGTLTMRINVTSAQMDLTWEDVYVCRVNSSGVSQETLGSSTGMAKDVSGGGVFSEPVTLSAASAHNAGDKVYVTCTFANAFSMASRSVAITPDQDIDTPFSVAAGTDVQASVDALTLTEQPATVNAETNVQAATDSLTLTGLGASVLLDVNVLAATDTLSLTEQAATVNAETNIQTTLASLTLTEFSATISTGGATEVLANTDALTLTEFSATVNAETNVQAGVTNLTLTEQPATVNAATNVQANADSLSVTPQTAGISLDVTVGAAVSALSLSTFAADVNLDASIAANADTLLLTTHDATVTPAVEEDASSYLRARGSGWFRRRYGGIW